MTNLSILDLLKSKTPATAHPFLLRVHAHCADHGIQQIVVNAPQVKFDSTSCSGYFSSATKQFAVAIGKPFNEWFAVFIHEYCHFLQFLDDPSWFSRIDAQGDQLFSWVGGEERLDAEAIKLFVHDAALTEFDCESRVLANLKDFGILDLIDTVDYARKANAYFNFYHYVGKHREWYVKGHEPYTLPECWEQFGPELKLLTSMSPELEEAYSHCTKHYASALT